MPAKAVGATGKAMVPGGAQGTASGEVLGRGASPAMRDSASLEIATARLAQTGALLESALSARYPQVPAALRDQRLRTSEHRPLTNYAAPQCPTGQGAHLPVLSVSHEIDCSRPG